MSLRYQVNKTSFPQDIHHFCSWPWLNGHQIPATGRQYCAVVKVEFRLVKGSSLTLQNCGWVNLAKLHFSYVEKCYKTHFYFMFIWRLNEIMWVKCLAYAWCSSVHFSSVAQSCPTLRPHESARQASLSITNSRSSLKPTSIKSVMPSSHLILCGPLFFLPPIPPSIRLGVHKTP